MWCSFSFSLLFFCSFFFPLSFTVSWPLSPLDYTPFFFLSKPCQHLCHVPKSVTDRPHPYLYFFVTFNSPHTPRQLLTLSTLCLFWFASCRNCWPLHRPGVSGGSLLVGRFGSYNQERTKIMMPNIKRIQNNEALVLTMRKAW